jgi:hypothetical protein
MKTRQSVPDADRRQDFQAIEQAARDFIEAWYSADAERMKGSLHGDLVKRSVYRAQADGKVRLRRVADAKMMVDWTKEGGGSDLSPSDQRYEIEVFDSFKHIATAKVVSHEYVDFLHLAKIEEAWVIVNDLWELREGEFDDN